MSRRFVPKNSIVTMEQVHEDFDLEDIYTTHKGKAGDWICTREEDKSKFILADEYVKEMYVEVEKVDRPKNDFTYEEMAKGYAEMGNLEQEETWSYINKESSLTSNKAL